LKFYELLGRFRFSFFLQTFRVALSRQYRAPAVRFGANLRRMRVAAGLTQAKLAERLELGLRAVQKYEAGEINVPLATLDRVRRALRCTWDELLGAWDCSRKPAKGRGG
jgi:DNA-binding XRE family transcriptional regulator